MIRVNQFDDIAKNTIDEWIYFFKNSEIPDNFKAKGIAEAREKLKTITMTPEQLAEYNQYLQKLSSDASISQTLKFEIEYKKSIEIATELLRNGVNKNTISISLKLPIEIIHKLAGEL